MGRAKAWLPWRGQPMLAYVVERLREVVDEVVVVSSAELALPPVEALLVRDSAPAEGPLQGLAEGLVRVEAPLAFVTGTDAPFLRADFVRAMLAFGVPVALVQDGFVQTLAAVYPREAAARARELLARGRRRPLDLLEAVDYRQLDASDLPGTDGLRGFNTPEQYLAAVASDVGDATARLEFSGSLGETAGVDELEVPVGSLAELLARAPEGLGLCEGEAVSPRYRVSLDGRDWLVDTRVPIGPGERVIVSDAGGQGPGKSGLQ